MPNRLLFFLLILTVCSPLASVHASDTVPDPASADACNSNGEFLHTGDDLWMISTRHLCCPRWDSPDDPDFQVLRYIPSEGWQDSTWASWRESGRASAATIVYVHGNRIDWNRAFQRGTTVYRSLRRHALATQPIRFVIWSWPSTRQCGPGKDAKAKAARADLECHYFARFLRQLEPESRLGLIGYSYGARIVSGGLHLTAGGRLDGRLLPDTGDTPDLSVRVALLAAAMHNYWWLPGCKHDRCLSQVEQMLVLFNPCDPALRWYPRLDRRNRPRALGSTSAACPSRLGDDAQRLEQRNVACEIGNTHDADAYFGSTSIMTEIVDRLLDEESPGRP